MRSQFFGARGVDQPDVRAPRRGGRRVSLGAARHPRRRRRGQAVRPARRGRSSWSCTPRRSPRTTGRRQIPDRLHDQRQRHAEPAARRRAAHAAGRDVHLHLDEQGVRRSPQLPAAAGPRHAPGAAELTVARRDRHGHVDRPQTHSLFGVSKAAADLLVQEHGRYFGMPTVCFRGGCLTGPQHAGAQLHGFLAYLMKCTVTGEPYTIFGYGGKQVRDNIHAHDVVRAFAAFHAAPRAAAVYNLGGGRDSNVSMLEAIELCQKITGRELDYTLSDSARIGDHRWWISDIHAFAADYSGVAPDLRHRGRSARDLRAQRRAVDVNGAMRLACARIGYRDASGLLGRHTRRPNH